MYHPWQFPIKKFFISFSNFRKETWQLECPHIPKKICTFQLHLSKNKLIFDG